MEEQKQETITTNQSTEKIRNDKRNNKVVIICIVLAVVFVCSAMLLFSGLNKEQKLLYENCLDMQSRLKDPSSFVLYDALVMNFTDVEDGTTSRVYFISYGGKNSYGGMVREEVVYWNNEYFGPYDELNDREGPYDERTFFALLAHSAYIFDLQDENSYQIEVDVAPVIKKFEK